MEYVDNDGKVMTELKGEDIPAYINQLRDNIKNHQRGVVLPLAKIDEGAEQTTASRLAFLLSSKKEDIPYVEGEDKESVALRQALNYDNAQAFNKQVVGSVIYKTMEFSDKKVASNVISALSSVNRYFESLRRLSDEFYLAGGRRLADPEYFKELTPEAKLSAYNLAQVKHLENSQNPVVGEDGFEGFSKQAGRISPKMYSNCESFIYGCYGNPYHAKIDAQNVPNGVKFEILNVALDNQVYAGDLVSLMKDIKIENIKKEEREAFFERLAPHTGDIYVEQVRECMPQEWKQSKADQMDQVDYAVIRNHAEEIVAKLEEVLKKEPTPENMDSAGKLYLSMLGHTASVSNEKASDLTLALAGKVEAFCRTNKLYNLPKEFSQIDEKLKSQKNNNEAVIGYAQNDIDFYRKHLAAENDEMFENRKEYEGIENLGNNSAKARESFRKNFEDTMDRRKFDRLIPKLAEKKLSEEETKDIISSEKTYFIKGAPKGFENHVRAYIADIEKICKEQTPVDRASIVNLSSQADYQRTIQLLRHSAEDNLQRNREEIKRSSEILQDREKQLSNRKEYAREWNITYSPMLNVLTDLERQKQLAELSHQDFLNMNQEDRKENMSERISQVRDKVSQQKPQYNPEKQEKSGVVKSDKFAERIIEYNKARGKE